MNYDSIVDGCSSASATADRWHSHFEDVYNSISNIKSQLQFRAHVLVNVNVFACKTFTEVFAVAIPTGHDDMAME